MQLLALGKSLKRRHIPRRKIHLHSGSGPAHAIPSPKIVRGPRCVAACARVCEVVGLAPYPLLTLCLETRSESAHAVEVTGWARR